MAAAERDLGNAGQFDDSPPAATVAPRPGSAFMSPELQAMQRDDMANPGMLWVADGEALWRRPAGASERSCASCHGAAEQSMRGVAARLPAFDAARRGAIDLRQRIESCRQDRQIDEPWPPESQRSLSLEAYVAHQSRGMPIAPPDDPRLAAARERGRKLFEQRIGQLDLSCAQCHDANAGRRLGGSTIPPADTSGYPVYRLEWQALGSLQRRLRNCMSGVRAQPYEFGAQELIDLELHLNARAEGVAVETPGVRP
ncbi:MAG: sulfur oxidation c-type cytochrome SoxA [Methylibium sp.]|nr:sulfur oxidation c-type cytochrome SoxA [Methylibium sp.]